MTSYLAVKWAMDNPLKTLVKSISVATSNKRIPPTLFNKGYEIGFKILGYEDSMGGKDWMWIDNRSIDFDIWIREVWKIRFLNFLNTILV